MGLGSQYHMLDSQFKATHGELYKAMRTEKELKKSLEGKNEKAVDEKAEICTPEKQKELEAAIDSFNKQQAENLKTIVKHRPKKD